MVSFEYFERFERNRLKNRSNRSNLERFLSGASTRVVPCSDGVDIRLDGSFSECLDSGSIVRPYLQH